MRNRLLTFGFVFVCFFSSLRASAQQLNWSVFHDSISPYEQTFNVYSGEQMMTIDGAGNQWILFEENNAGNGAGPDIYGAARFNGVSWTHFTQADGLMGGPLYAIIRDHSGNIWVSGDSGIAEYSNGVWHTYQYQDNFSNLRIFGSLAADSSGNIWVASAERGFYYIRLNLTGDLNGLPIMNTIDTLITQVFRFDGKNWTLFPLDVIWHGNGISSLATNASGIIWAVGGQKDTSLSAPPIEGLWKLTDNVWTVYNLDDGNGTLQKASPGTNLKAIAVHANDNGGAWVSFASVTDNKSLTLSYPPAVNFFNGNEWATSEFTGARFSDVWLAPSGVQYFKSLPSGSDPSKGGIVTVSNTGTIVDSISRNNIPYFPFYCMEFVSNGNPWLSSGYDGLILETFSESSDVAPQASSVFSATAYPNPCTSNATLTYTLPKSGMITIALYNSLGMKVAQLINEEESAGAHATAISSSGFANGAYCAEISCVGTDGNIMRQNVNVAILQ